MEDQFDDPRANWMKPRVAGSLKIKEDKFIKSASENDHTAVLMNFFESEEVHTVFVYENKQGDLIISEHAPETFRRKAVYFTKASGVSRLEKDKPIKDQVFYGDYTPNVVQMLRTKLDYMYLPLLKAEQFTKDWPDMLYQDVVKQSDKFSQVIYTTEGKIQGKCLLPVPSEAGVIYQKICTIAQDSQSATLSIISQLDKQARDSAHDVEAVVLDWIKQIRVVINTQPEDIIKGQHPLPMEEIDFWVHKTDNLNSIIEQLNAEKAKVVIEVLKSIDSTYYPALIKTIEEVHQTLAECNSNTQFLTPLRPLFQQLLDEADIKEASNILQAIFKALYIIWFHAPFYNSSTRYVFLIRSLCNLIIKQMRTILEGENILKNEPTDSLILVENVSKLADDFIILYKKYAEKVVEDCREMGDQSQEDAGERQRISQALIQLQHEFIEKSHKNKKRQQDKADADLAAAEEKPEDEEPKPEEEQPEEKPAEEAPEEEKVQINAYRRYKFNKGCWPILSLVFKRFEAFVERIKDIHRVITINACMQRLEKLEVGGVQGDALSKQIQQIFSLYNAKTAIFLESTYDPTDLQIELFEEDYGKFIKHYTSWEKRLVAVLETGIDSAITLEQSITVVESFSGILPEAVLKNVVQAKFGHFNNMFLALLQKIFDEFTVNKEDPPLEKNQPPLSGAVMWSRVLLNKARVPYKKLDALNTAYLERAESVVKDDRFEVSRAKFLEIVQKLKEYEVEMHRRWLSGIDMVCTEKLAEKLLVRVQPNLIEFQNDVYTVPEGIVRDELLDEIKLIKTNFSVELTDLMEETKIFKILDMDVSEDALEVFSKADNYRQVKIQLDVIQNQYNFVQKQLVFVERPLFYSQLKYIETMLVDGIEKLTWKDSSSDITSFLERLNLPLNVFFQQVSTLKDNLKAMQQLLVTWSNSILVEKPAKAPVSLDKTPDTIQTKLNNMKETQSQKITEAVECSKQVIFFTSTEDKPITEEQEKVMSLIGFNPDQLVQFWDLYLLWLAEYIQCGLLDIVIANIKSLQKYMDDSETIEHNEFDNSSAIINENSYPFIEINMLIRHPDLFFEPQIQLNATQLTLEQMLSQWIDSFCNIAKCVPNPTQSCTDEKLKTSNDFRDFHFNIMRNSKFIQAKDKIKARVLKRASVAAESEENYDKYKPVYQTDRKAYLQRFLKDGPNVPLSGDYDIESMADKTQHIVRTIVKQNQAQEDNGEEGKDGESNQKTDNGPTVQTIEMELKYYRVPDIYDFNDAIEKYRNIREEVSQNVPLTIRIGWLQINVRGAKTSLLQLVDSFKDLFTNHLIATTNSRLQNLSAFCNNAKAKLQSEITAGPTLEEALTIQKNIKDNTLMYDTMFEPIKELMQMLQRHNIQFAPEVSSLVESLPKEWEKVKQISYNKREELAPLVQEETQKTFEAVKTFQNKVWDFKEHFKSKGPFLRDVGLDRAYEMLDTCLVEIGQLRDEALFLTDKQKLFDSSFANDKEMEEINLIANLQKELVSLKLIWDITDMVESQLGSWNNTLFKDIDVDYMEENMKKFVKEIRSVDRMSRGNDVYVKLDNLVKNFLKTLPLVQKLRSHAMRGRHWEQLKDITQVTFTIDDKFQLSDLIKLNLHEHSDAVEEIVSKAEKELSMEKQLTALNTVWKDLNFNFIHHGDVNLVVLDKEMLEADSEQLKSGKEILYNIQVPEEVADQLEQDQLAVQNMVSNKYVKFFYDEVMDWQKKLAQVDSVILVWTEVQRTWSYLYPIFIGSQDIREQLPEDSKRFEDMNESWIVAMNSAVWISNCIESASQPGLLENMEQMQEKLQKCEKALADYLDTKRRLFPRFYFVSSVDLLDILSKGQQPKQVEKHLSKIFDNMHTLKWTTDDALCKEATAMVSGENEVVQMHENCICDGPVESWLNKLVVYMMDTLRYSLLHSLQSFADMDREKWLDVFPAQICLVALQNFWTSDTSAAFERLEEGNEQAMKEYNKKQNDALLNFITMTQGDLDKNMRTKIATICTIEVHSKDIVAALIRDKIDIISAFAWQSQLKFRWDEQKQDCYVNICDAEFIYTYEYLGCTARLVVTALTDRCYITLTQSLHLILGGAPAGPAGTGKTETTKDLGRALGRMVYVFNCSPEMDYRSLGNIFYGLSLSGSWGCFDEFNRIEVEVLSVVAMQVKTVLDAIRADKQYFTLGDEEERPGMPKAQLNKHVGYFITMNPGYAGRAELPDNLKALFRGVAMVVPDFCQITEIMLISNGFMAARELAKKFITLYNLNKELLSKQDHYDWGLRAIIAICRTAGMLRRTMIAPIKRK